MFHVCSNVLLISSSFFGSIASSCYFSVVSFCFLASFISFLMCNLVFFIWTLPPTSTALSYINCSKSSNVVALSFVSLCCKCCWYLFRNVSEIIFYEVLFSLLILAISFLHFYCYCCMVSLVCSFHFRILTAQKWRFPLRFSSENMTKSAVFCGFGHIYWRNP